ncbi:MAG TPA: hypothetical protein VF857_03520, partial [Spirochaetota bacterium]
MIFIRRILSVLFMAGTFISLSHNLYAETPYALSWGKEASFLGAAGAFYGVSYYLMSEKQKPVESEISRLNPDDVNRFDRSAIRNRSETSRRWSDYLLYTAVALPVVIEGFDNHRNLKDMGTIGLMYAEAALLNSAVTQMAKGIVDRDRPYTYNQSLSMEERMAGGVGA